ncbi:hypothetical protein Taro_000673 [Colocasia esculenta]|uniref:Uncharacterized protein n=1 Tax=Colocasia esculenta TaxID=4460 RepID=A0A843T8R1_COLES|nr:hypothetical protein [Colocasia esculenta]
MARWCVAQAAVCEASCRLSWRAARSGLLRWRSWCRAVRHPGSEEAEAPQDPEAYIKGPQRFRFLVLFRAARIVL